jgi:UDP-N-acetylglucosamine 2-epimerase (non-hydrolysing)
VLDQVLALFDIKPDVDLYLICPNQTLAQLMSMVFDGLEPIIKSYQPIGFLLRAIQLQLC